MNKIVIKVKHVEDPAIRLRNLLTKFQEVREEYQNKYRELQDIYFDKMNNILSEISEYFED